jgi:hypothetical protein
VSPVLRIVSSSLGELLSVVWASAHHTPTCKGSPRERSASRRGSVHGGTPPVKTGFDRCAR